jgi:hypothetical protein
MESGDIGSRRADCGSAVAVICDVTILLPFLPELYAVPGRTFNTNNNNRSFTIRNDAVTCDLGPFLNGPSSATDHVLSDNNLFCNG